MARNALRERGAGDRRRSLARSGNPHRDQSCARIHADPDDHARRDRLRGRRGARRGGEGDPAAGDADPPGLGRRPAAAIRGERLPLVHQDQEQGGAAMNAPFLPRVLRSYQQRAATWLYERDAAFLIAPLGAGKGAAALTAAAELIRDGLRRHILVIAPKLVATTVWPSEVASWPHLAHLKIAVLNSSPERRRELLATAAEREVTVIGIDLVPWLVAELARVA